MRNGGSDNTWKVIPIGGEAHTVTASPDAQAVHLSNPSLMTLASGRIIVAVDQAGSGLKGLPGAKGRNQATGRHTQGILLTSSDHGANWEEKERFPFGHARLFRDGHNLYALGHHSGQKL